MIREGQSWRPVGWDEALTCVAAGLRRVIEREGPDAVGVLGSARQTNEENYLTQKFARNVIGTNNIDCCARVCHTPSATSLKRMLGSGLSTNSFDDIEHAGVILVCGANPTENHPVVGARIKQAVRRRRAVTPHPTCTDEEREIFYTAMGVMGELLAKHGVAVIFDATAHRRAWREHARQRIARFAEVYVDCTEEICRARDPKGIYRKAREGLATSVPGVQVPYEAPARPEVIVQGDRMRPDEAVQRIIDHLIDQRWICR
jgi:NADH dehydrogenase/NADH:ubiquinone oxidoreductase subunit G